MYLKRMEIIGFKSFAQRTVIEFHDGITVVVGPNGCGKSNVFDAVRWALGEQSAKTMRGQSMTDVIFNGTQTAAPSNYAEVTLVFDNKEHMMPIEFDEVSITRKLFRSGESEYYLNKSISRLRDIHQLLLSVGLGEGSYSFVMQGTIDRIVTRRPEEKRTIFDEAAGILQYKERKREVANKLKLAEEDLLRVEDIVIEVKRQRDSLARQVQRAEKYKELKVELEALEKDLAVVTMKDIRTRMDGLLDELNGLQENDGKHHVEIEALQNVCAEKTEAYDILRGKQDEAKREVITIEARAENNKSRTEMLRQRFDETRRRLMSIHDFKVQYHTRKEDQTRRITQLTQELSELELVHEQVNTRVGSIQLEIDAAAEVVSGKKETVDFVKDRIKRSEEERNRVLDELRQVHKEADGVTVRRQRFVDERAKAEGEIVSYEQRAAELTASVAAKQTEIDAERVTLKSKHEELDALFAKLDTMTVDLSDKEKEMVKLHSQLDFVKNMNVSYADLPYEEEVEVRFSQSLPELPAVLVGRVEEGMVTTENGIVRVKTNVKVVSSNIEKLNAAIADLSGQIVTLKKEIEQAQRRRGELKDETRRLEQTLQVKESELSRLTESKRNTLERVDQLKKQIADIGIASADLDKAFSMLEEKETSLDEVIKRKERDMLDVSAELENLQEEIAIKSAQLGDLEVEKARIGTRLSTIESEKTGKSENVRLFSSDLNAMTGQFDSLMTEEQDLEEKQTVYTADLRVIEADEDQILAELQVKRDALLVLIEEERTLLDEKQTAESRLRGIQSDIDRTQKAVYDKKFQLQNVQHEEERLLRDLSQLYEIQVTAEELLTRESSDTPKVELEAKEEELKRRIKFIGAVNLAAPEEYAELNTRYEFLEKQKSDLLESKDTLQKALQKINKTSRELFLETFEKIRVEFISMFRFLFAGGKADVVLLNPDDVLESGIDIIVQPPGKKLQSVTLLSGGEKSMTAIALIFAIFKVKPSPLCVLDEIDAALDEANVDRFNHVLREYSKFSQFLVVSHNKKTISAADVMYGVTMQQSGISRIVSVRLTEEGKTQKVAHPARSQALSYSTEHGHKFGDEISEKPDLGDAAAHSPIVTKEDDDETVAEGAAPVASEEPAETELSAQTNEG